MSDKILLFIPCYNCAPQIERVLAQLRIAHAASINDVLVLDNGSTDDTVERAARMAGELTRMRVTIGRNLTNYHLGGSHKAAFAHAERHGFGHVVVLHGDDQASLSDLMPLIAAGEHHRHDALLGARFMEGARLEGYSRLRSLGNRAFNMLFGIVGGRRVHDLGSGLNMFSRTIFTDAAVTRASDDLRFNVHLLLGMIDRGRTLHFFPISWRETDQVSNVRLLSQSLRTLSIAWSYAVDRARFRTRDHRDRQVKDYAFDTVWPSRRGETSHD